MITVNINSHVDYFRKSLTYMTYKEWAKASMALVGGKT